jgi:hypothetical protein
MSEQSSVLVTLVYYADYDVFQPYAVFTSEDLANAAIAEYDEQAKRAHRSRLDASTMRLALDPLTIKEAMERVDYG